MRIRESYPNLKFFIISRKYCRSRTSDENFFLNLAEKNVEELMGDYGLTEKKRLKVKLSCSSNCWKTWMPIPTFCDYVR